jgi:hypothetical protein
LFRRLVVKNRRNWIIFRVSRCELGHLAQIAYQIFVWWFYAEFYNSIWLDVYIIGINSFFFFTYNWNKF